MIKRLVAATVLALFCARLPAEGLPDLGDPARGELSQQAERRIGESLMRDMRWRDSAYLDDPEIEDYLNALGNRLVAASEDAHGDFRFFAIKDPLLNAFAWPGGFIGVHTALILATESESELASVLAHEISHVTQHHIVRLYATQNLSSATALAGLLVAILAAHSNAQASEAAIATTQALGIQRQLNFTREFEREADRLGIQTLGKAGFDVRGMSSFFERLQKSTRLYDNNAPSYLRTHPLTTERIADIDARVSQARYRQLADSLDFQLVRAKLRAMNGSAADAVKDFQSLLDERRMPVPVAQYGLARAALRAGDIKLAGEMVSQLAARRLENPMIDALGAEVRLAANDRKGALAIYRQASERYPGSRALRYGLLENLIETGASLDALNKAALAAQANTQDERLFSIAARAAAVVGKRAAQHRYQGEVYALKGSLPEAIEQLELAREARDGDFFEQSVIDVRLREFKKRRREELAEKNQPQR